MIPCFPSIINYCNKILTLRITFSPSCFKDKNHTIQAKVQKMNEEKDQTKQ